MLKKQYRLKNKSAFIAIYNKKHSVHKGGVTLFAGDFKKNDNLPTTVGFVVSKKTHKRAVKRNRLKRLIRESYRVLLFENNSCSHSCVDKYKSLIFVGHGGALEKSFSEIKEIVEYLIQQI